MALDCASEADRFTVLPEEAKSRLDVVTAEHLQCSRSQAHDWITSGLLTIDGAVAVKPAEKVKSGQFVEVSRPPLQSAIPQPDKNVIIEAVYEDDMLLVVNKQRGVTVHPGSGTHSGTLVNGLLAYCHDLSGIHGVERPGIVHRLDKDTSGLMVVAKSDQAHLALSRQFADRQVLKIYRAIVHGVPPESGSINQPIGRHQTDRKKMTVRRDGRPASTDFRVLEQFGREYALVELHLHTGRTHQIRVHMTWLGYPLLGDLVYGKRSNPWNLNGQALHCYRLGFTHPRSGEFLEFTAGMPAVLEGILGDLRLNFHQVSVV
ncbi:MAG: RluA family pseudouridine synthase [bacterium]|nr:RluA family pseudouridine synthase [bacterium]